MVILIYMKKKKIVFDWWMGKALDKCVAKTEEEEEEDGDEKNNMKAWKMVYFLALRFR